jgi:hypothetical protein
MMKKIFSYALIFILLGITGCQRKEKLENSAPAVLPRTERMMKSPGFWIARLPAADDILLDAEGIFRFNETLVNELKLTKDLTKLGPVCSGEELKGELLDALKTIQKSVRFDKNGFRVRGSYFKRQKNNMGLAAIAPRVTVRYGFIFRYADQRILPTDDILTAEPGDIEFDELQNSSLDIATPVAVVHESKDGAWVYAHTASSSGWVKKSCVVFCAKEEFKKFIETKPFARVINAKADIYFDPQLRTYYDYVRMGALFPVTTIDQNVAQVVIPFPGVKGTFTERLAYLKREDVSLGDLVYTPRTIIRQAYKLLNAPYGWGGMGGEQDCSSFIQEVFATVGINLPRNSSEQGKIGHSLGEFKSKTADAQKYNVLANALGGATIIQLKGHVLLYLGTYNGQPYAIHETHGFGQKIGWFSHGRILNRVVVSDLLLGKGSKKGSLLERIVAIRAVE